MILVKDRDRRLFFCELLVEERIEHENLVTSEGYIQEVQSEQLIQWNLLFFRHKLSSDVLQVEFYYVIIKHFAMS